MRPTCSHLGGESQGRSRDRPVWELLEPGWARAANSLGGRGQPSGELQCQLKTAEPKRLPS